ncbi:hypothetical protein ACFQQB_66885 [Nonomuraea rubra]
MDDQVIVFSYGTLRQRDVQLSVFGRRSPARPTGCAATGWPCWRSPTRM